MKKIMAHAGAGLLVAALAGTALAAPKQETSAARHKRVLQEYEVKHKQNLAHLEVVHKQHLAEQQRRTNNLNALKRAHDAKIVAQKKKK